MEFDPKKVRAFPPQSEEVRAAHRRIGEAVKANRWPEDADLDVSMRYWSRAQEHACMHPPPYGKACVDQAQDIMVRLMEVSLWKSLAADKAKAPA
jgi:hypothetical protein